MHSSSSLAELQRLRGQRFFCMPSMKFRASLLWRVWTTQGLHAEGERGRLPIFCDVPLICS